jgi:hypothetical protein
VITQSLFIDSVLVLAATLLACVVVVLVYLVGFHEGWKQHRRELRSLGREADRLNAGRSN